MKKETFTHFAFLFTLLLLVFLVKRWLDITFLLLILGAVVGTILPDVDHLIYIYYLRPHELTAQRVQSKLTKRQVIEAVNLLAMTRSERKQLIFHTVTFQIIFIILALLVLTSSGSIFGRGLVLAFLLHLLVDQLVDLIETDTLASWFRQLSVSLNKTQMVLYWLVNLIILLFFAFFL